MLNWKPREMANVNEGLHQLAVQIQQIATQLQESERKRVELEQRIEAMYESIRRNNPQCKQR